MRRYPSADDITEMWARGYDRSTIDEAVGLSERREWLDRVKAKIHGAFKDVQLGSGVGLREAQSLDNYAGDAERAACRASDRTTDWQLISSEELNECNSSLSFFDAEGMRFHLPAYLIADLDGEYRFGMAFCLTRHSREGFSLLNKAQAAAVRDYLLFIEEEPDYERDREDIRRALEESWVE